MLARSLKQINSKVHKKYPTVNLVKANGEGYFYLYSDDYLTGIFLASLETTSIYINTLKEYPLERWVEDIFEIVKDFDLYITLKNIKEGDVLEVISESHMSTESELTYGHNFRVGTKVIVSEFPRDSRISHEDDILFYWCEPADKSKPNKEIASDVAYAHWCKNWSKKFADSYDGLTKGMWIPIGCLKLELELYNH